MELDYDAAMKIPILIDIARIGKMNYNGCEVSTFALDLRPINLLAQIQAGEN